MKLLMKTFVAAAVAALALGCNWLDGDSEHDPMHEGMSTMEHAGAEMRESAQDMEDYTYEKKSQFVAKSKKELAEIRSELDRLSGEIDRSAGAAKVEARQKLKVVQEKWEQARMQLDRAQNATESTWDDVVRGFQKSNAELRETFADTRQWLSEKIEP